MRDQERQLLGSLQKRDPKSLDSDELETLRYLKELEVKDADSPASPAQVAERGGAGSAASRGPVCMRCGSRDLDIRLTANHTVIRCKCGNKWTTIAVPAFRPGATLPPVVDGPYYHPQPPPGTEIQPMDGSRMRNPRKVR